MWEEGGHFGASAAAVKRGGEPYVIVIPPPNVTSVLHMGHGLNNTIQDVLIRWQRMRGKVALWVPGTDHAGIATQNIVERQLARTGRTRHDLERRDFEQLVWEHVAATGDRIIGQLKAIGCSCDWDRTRFTLDPELSRAVREMFVRLYEDGLVYRGEYIINWCPRCLTALSNEEAEGVEAEGSLWRLRYPLAVGHGRAARRSRAAGARAVDTLADGRWCITVSTTRPETMLGDTGVAVHPDDPRYAPLVGAEVELPLAGRTIPIVADGHVSPDFGTGMVKVTPAHDPNDFEIARRAGLDVVNVLTETGAMNANAPEAFRGVDRFAARRRVLDAMRAEGLLAGADPHAHVVPRCYRCDTVVEPRLSEQWFVRMQPLAEAALEGAREGAVAFSPDRWTKVYERWMEGIRDWCISRQLWWGHRIPVWYCRDCDSAMACREDPEACKLCGGAALEQDPDVLDTWFSSWLWPFSVFGWPDDTPDLKAFYPGHVLSTAPEILFFWVARMIMAGYRAMGEAPFARVYLHGTVRDARGRKMSKSLGNGVDPLEVVSLYGADALRFTVLAGAGVGADIRLDHEDLEATFAPGRNFVNKLWNTGRFAVMSIGNDPIPPLADVRSDLALEDRWILSRLQRAITRVERELDAFRMQGAAEALRDFVRGDFADWYLESVKDRLRPDGYRRAAARSTLAHALGSSCRLLHPLVPFVTEELWTILPRAETAGEGDDRPLVAAMWPTPDPDSVDAEAEAEFGRFQELIGVVRGLRKEYGAGEGKRVVVHLAGEASGFASLRSELLERLARISSLETTVPLPGEAGASAVLSDGTELFMPLTGVVDVDREVDRARREVERIENLLEGIEAKLANSKFLTRAPAKIVEREREKLASCKLQLTKWKRKLTSLGGGE